MVRILRPMGRGLIYVWAKNQALQSKSSYLLQNKRNHKENSDEADAKYIEEKAIDKNPIDETGERGQSSLPIHTNRTEFEHNDILVPWKLKNSKQCEKSGVNDQHPTTFLRFYHVFEEGELEQLFHQFTNVSIVKSYYDQGNWCVIFQKMSNQ